MISSNANLHPQSRSSETDIRTVSSASLYSTAYSYYEYESASPSPSGDRPPTHVAEVEHSQRSPSSKSSKGFSPQLPGGLRTPQEYLQLGIQHHEANRLQESARCFERSATEEGGCGVGMLMYGLTLRHGWGCAKNEKAGFKWLRKAAEHAVEDLEKVRMNGEKDVRVIEASLNVFHPISRY
jgi:TPR repeat protein